jgi:hypothetical protein
MNYTISDTLLNKILGYLGNRPYVETFELIQGIQSGIKVVEPTESTGEKSVQQSN